jgi:hypothetical protein
MSRNKIILLLGLWVALLPYLGFPGGLENLFYVVSGLLISFLAFSALRIRRKSSDHFEKGRTFEENYPESPRGLESDVVSQDQASYYEEDSLER